MLGIDLFSGAGGLSVGAKKAGLRIHCAVESDKYAADTYAKNHKGVHLIVNDIGKVKEQDLLLPPVRSGLVLFGGPPCQGFSTSNQQTRGSLNVNSNLFRHYLRLVSKVRPDWVLFENVKGLLETENGYFLEQVVVGFEKLGMTTSSFVLNSADFGVPQKRNRLFIVASKHGIKLSPPKPTHRKHVSVAAAIGDLPELANGDSPDVADYSRAATNSYAKSRRGNLRSCANNLVTKNAEYVIKRYSYIPQGGNWQDIPKRLMKNYADRNRCHTGIYHRLRADEPSVVIGNFRKNMLVHPWKDRGLSVREAARLQSFDDDFVFTGSIGFQQQQVANAVPPLLACAVFKEILALSRTHK